MLARLKALFGMLRALFQRGKLEERLRDELEFHVERVTERNLRQGMPLEEAERQARIEVGRFEQVRETVRDARGFGRLEDAVRDLRYALRGIRKNPGFAAAAILTVALGLGANTAIFTVVNAVLLRPLPLADAGRLVTVWEKRVGAEADRFRSLQPGRKELISTSVPILKEWQAETDLFEDVGAYYSFPAPLVLTGSGAPEEVIATRVTANFFSVLGVRPELGRAFLPGEDTMERRGVAVLSHELWQRRFGGDRTIAGKQIALNGGLITVVGVMPAGFQPWQGEQVWVPHPVDAQLGDGFRGSRNMSTIARLKPGVSVEHVQAVLKAKAEARARAFPRWSRDWTTVVVPLREYLTGDMRARLLLLFGATIFVVLIACANLANMLLARGTTRRREMALRAALGAGSWRLVRQAIAETSLLALLGGAAGLGLGMAAVKMLAGAGNLGELGSLHVDWRVLGFAFCASAFVGLLSALVPAWQAAKSGVNDALKESDARVSPRRFGGLLVVSELACALILLAGAGLMLNTLARLATLDFGFSPRNLLTLRVTLPPYKYALPPNRWNDARERAFLTAALERIKAVPGVREAGAIYPLPLSKKQEGTGISAEGSPEDSDVPTHSRIATADYFRTLQIPLLRGRYFTDFDSADKPPVVIVNETLARQLWPGQDPIGKRVRLYGKLPEVVGVVGDVRHLRPDLPSGAETYMPRAQTAGYSTMFIAVRLAPSTAPGVWEKGGSVPPGIVDAVQAAVWSVDRDQPVQDVQMMEERLSAFAATRRIYTLLLGIFAAIALALSAVGLYGVISYSVSQRRNEIGIRMALGAKRGQVIRMVLRQGLLLAAIGVPLGIGGALTVTRALSTMLYGVRAADPATLVAASLLLGAVALAASYVPARRAAEVDPMVALRAE